MNNIRNTYANVVNVNGTREEIEIRFGKTMGAPFLKKQTQVQTTNRIILSPYATKRLAALLHTHIKEYDERYGSLDEPAFSTPDTIELGIDLLPSEFRTLRTEKEGGLLLDLIRNLGVKVGFERSIKLFPDVVLANRFLAGFRRKGTEDGMDKNILGICRAVDMPHDFLKAFQEGLPEANIVLFGFEEQEKNCVYKAYLEFGGRFDKIFEKTDNQPDPFIIHVGYKWDTRENSRNAVAEYKCFPGIPVKAILGRLSNSFYGNRADDIFEITSKIIDMALRRIEPHEILYLEVGEENNPRRSFDLNIYRANLTLEELYPFLLKMFKYFSISPKIFNDLYEPVKKQIFGHISGGIDREGRDFLTIYFGVKGSSRVPG
ncbi:MAG: DUF3467 domain-containing protein [Deltaproteobacteria bacterium]|nr:DUF3467 domain-containing protein [Deltaproteobacteria bacterium]